MENFLKCMGWVNWLGVAVIFQFNSGQTWTMFGCFFLLVLLFLIIMSVTLTLKKADGFILKKTPTSIIKLVVGNIIDVLFFSGVAYIIQNDLPFNIVILGILVRGIMFGVSVNGRFVKG